MTGRMIWRKVGWPWCHVNVNCLCLAMFFFLPWHLSERYPRPFMAFCCFFATICGGKNAETLIQRSYTHIYIWCIYLPEDILVLFSWCLHKKHSCMALNIKIHVTLYMWKSVNLLCPSASSMGSGDIKPENVMLDACLVMIWVILIDVSWYHQRNCGCWMMLVYWKLLEFRLERTLHFIWSRPFGFPDLCVKVMYWKGHVYKHASSLFVV